MKKKKYQFAGSTNPCGEGTRWDANTLQCVPIPKNPNLDPVFQQNYAGNPTNFNERAYTNNNGKVVQSDVLPLDKNVAFDPNVGSYDKRGTFIPLQNVVGDALDKGFNYDSDNTYRKNEYTTDNNILGYNDTFKTLNFGLDLLHGVADQVNDIKTKKDERYKLLKARYNKSAYNPYENGLNKGGVYQKGGMARDQRCPSGNCNDGSQRIELPFFPKTNDRKAARLASRQESDYYNGEDAQWLQDRAGFYKNNNNFGKYPVTTFDPQPFAEVAQFPSLSKPDGVNYNPVNNVAQNGGQFQLSPQELDKLNKSSSESTSTNNQTVNQVKKNISKNLLWKHNLIVKNYNEANGINDSNDVEIQDNRKKLLASNQDINPNRDLKSGKYSSVIINNIIAAAKYNGIDPNTAIAIALQETNLGKVDPNYGHVKVSATDYEKIPKNMQFFAYNLTKTLKDKLALANKLGYTDEAMQLQSYNGYGKIGKNTEKDYINSNGQNTNNFYGVSTNIPIDLKKNPLYGKTIIDLRDNIIKKNQSIQDLINNYKSADDNGDISLNQTGGMVNNTGYTPGTSTYNNPYNIIPSEDITMKNTPFPVMAHPNNGQPKLMQPGQDYNFPGAKYVTEVPMKTGGKTDQYAGQTDKELASTILNSGKELTAKQKKHFKFVAEGRIPIDGHIKDAKKKGTYQAGGAPQEVEGVGPGEGVAELEKGEVFQTQQGNIKKVAESEPTHENDGSVQPDVHRVLEDTSDKRKDKDSKALRVTPADVKEMFGFKPKSTMSHSKVYEKAVDYYDKKLTKFEGKVQDNLDYIKQNGGQYAKNSLELNLKLMENMPSRGNIFDTVYDHQEKTKQMLNIDNADHQQYGGSPKKYAVGGGAFDEPVDPYKGGKTKKGRTTPTGLNNAFTFDGGLAAYKKAWSQAGLNLDQYTTNSDAQGAVYDYLLQNSPDIIRQMWKTYGNTAKGINNGLPVQFDDNYLDDTQNLQKLRQAYTDNLFGVRTLTPNTQPTNPPVEGQQNPPQQEDPYNPIQYDKPNPVEASKFNEPLRWYDTAGNLLNYLSSDERIPVSFEQLDRQPLKAHHLNPQPTLDANQGDFNAAIATLPNNGVGYANQANLLANKYKVNNEVLGQYANQNNQIDDRIDEVNSNNKFQLDQVNLNLRDRAVTQQLQGMEVERQSKLNALDDYFTKLAQNHALNRNGNLVLQMTPFFDQTGSFNGNKYIFQDQGNGTANVVDKQTGKLIKTITTDGYGIPKQTKTYIRN